MKHSNLQVINTFFSSFHKDHLILHAFNEAIIKFILVFKLQFAINLVYYLYSKLAILAENLYFIINIIITIVIAIKPFVAKSS